MYGAMMNPAMHGAMNPYMQQQLAAQQAQAAAYAAYHQQMQQQQQLGCEKVYSCGHLLVITRDYRDYTFNKWGYQYL